MPKSAYGVDVNSYYLSAKAMILKLGAHDEIEWQRSRNPLEFTEQDLLREGAWVILCCGFRESVVRQKFGYISRCFCDWQSAKEIGENMEMCIATAAYAFANTAKLLAIANLANKINVEGFDSIRQKIIQSPNEALLDIPFIGQVTSRHLLKNLGFDVSKADRHLVRLAAKFGYTSVDNLCSDISIATGDPVNVIDLVLWRHSVSA